MPNTTKFMYLVKPAGNPPSHWKGSPEFFDVVSFEGKTKRQGKVDAFKFRHNHEDCNELWAIAVSEELDWEDGNENLLVLATFCPVTNETIKVVAALPDDEESAVLFENYIVDFNAETENDPEITHCLGMFRGEVDFKETKAI